MSNVKKKIEVVMLPTEKATPIIHIGIMKRILFESNTSKYKGVLDKDESYQHLYFVSNEPIKEGDWFIAIDSSIQKAKANYEKLDNDKKVIATTDDLRVTTFEHFGALPSPSPQFIDKFIGEYNKGNVIKEVMVEYETKYPFENELGKKQDCLKVNKNNHITITRCKDSWSRGEITNKLKLLSELLEAQAAIDLHNETGIGKSGYEEYEEEIKKYRNSDYSFNVNKWIENNL
mgnify:FL=1